LRRSLRVFVEHYERERNHQGLGNRLIIPTPMNGQGLVKRRERLGRTINFYYRQAAWCSIRVGRLLAVMPGGTYESIR
jgi:hypothetical protein